MRRRGLPALVLAVAALCAAACAARPVDTASIVNSGSTNAAGWTLAIRSDGAGSLGVTGGSAKPFRIAPATATGFFRHMAAAKAAHLPIVQTCMKPVSFGSSTVAWWHGWRSPDLSCPQHSPLGSALAADAAAIEAAAGVSKLELRRRLIPVPNEPRRTEPTQTPRQGP